MKLYTLSEPTSYNFSKEEEEQELSLLELSQSSDWDSKEFDQISDLRVGEVIYFGSLRVDRVE